MFVTILVSLNFFRDNGFFHARKLSDKLKEVSIRIKKVIALPNFILLRKKGHLM
jgi:hypothetical protein